MAISPIPEAAEYCNYPDLSPVSAGFLGWFEFCSPARRGNAILTTHGAHGALGNVTTVGTESCDCRGCGRKKSSSLAWVMMKRQHSSRHRRAKLFPHQKNPKTSTLPSSLPSRAAQSHLNLHNQSSETPSSSLFNSF